MGGINLYPVQQEILTYLQAQINWEVDSGAVPEVATLHYVNGNLDPYVVVQFAELMPTSGGGSFGGALYDEYYSYVKALCVGQTDAEARELASLVTTKMLGQKFGNTTAVNKIYGGGVYAVASDNRLPVAFVATVSCRFGTNVQNVGSLT